MYRRAKWEKLIGKRLTRRSRAPVPRHRSFSPTTIIKFLVIPSRVWQCVVSVSCTRVHTTELRHKRGRRVQSALKNCPKHHRKKKHNMRFRTAAGGRWARAACSVYCTDVRMVHMFGTKIGRYKKSNSKTYYGRVEAFSFFSGSFLFIFYSKYSKK